MGRGELLGTPCLAGTHAAAGRGELSPETGTSSGLPTGGQYNTLGRMAQYLSPFP